MNRSKSKIILVSMMLFLGRIYSLSNLIFPINNPDSIRVTDYLFKARYSMRGGDFNTVKVKADSARIICDRLKFKWAYPELYKFYGAAYLMMGNPKTSYIYFQKGVRVSNEINDKLGAIDNLNGIASVFLTIQNPDVSIKYYNEALTISELLKDPKKVAMICSNIGQSYILVGDIAKANAYFQKSKDCYTSVKDTSGLISALIGLGDIQSKESKNEKALVNYHTALEYAQKTGHKRPLPDIYLRIAGLKYKLNDLNGMLYYLKRLDSLSINLTNIYVLSRKNELLYKYFQGKGDFKKAMFFADRYINLSDSLKVLEKSQELINANAGIEIARRDNQIKFIQLEKNKNELISIEKLKKRNLIILFLCCISIILIILTFLIIRSIKQTQKYKLIEIEKARDRSELLHLKSQISPHVIFNILNSIQYLISKDAARAREMILLFSELLRYQLYETDAYLIQIEQEIDYLIKYIEIQKIRKSDRCNLDISIDKKIVNIKIAPLLFVPIVENAFKYVTNDKELENFIRIKLYQSVGSKIILEVENTYYRNQNEIKTGLGISNLVARLNLIYGNEHVFKINQSERIYNVKLIVNGK